MKRDCTQEREKVIKINEEAIRDHLGKLVRSTVEETLNGLLDAEANRLCNAEKYQRSGARIDTRAGHYQRKLHTRAGAVTLKVPKLRQQTFETAPGVQMQNDWGEIVTDVEGIRTKVYFSVNTLGYSRRFHFWCTDCQDAEHTYEGVIRACEHFGGVPREVLVDNQKSIVILHRSGQGAQFNERFLDLAGHYGFLTRACRPNRARTKGKDERMVGYVKHNFFVRHRSFESFAHMNALALRWLSEEADLRMHGTVKEVVLERFAREALHLGPLPAMRYDTSYRDHRLVHWDCYLDVRGNRYSVPADYRGQSVTIRISLDDMLSVYAGEDLIATHRLRSVHEGWVSVPVHHADLWREASSVQRRDLAVYEEVLRCN